MKSTVSSKGQITLPQALRTRYQLLPGTEVEFELRDEGVLVRKVPEGRRVWSAVGSLKEKFWWPKGIPHTTDAYIDYVRGGSYKELTGARRGRRGR